MISCPVCNSNSIHPTRNKRGMCKACADEKNRSSKKMKQVTSFSFQDGCNAALHDSTNTSIHASSLLKCHPIKLKINKYGTTQKNLTVNALLHNEEIENISQEFNVSFGNITNTFEAEIQLAEQAETNSLCAKCDSVENAVDSEEISKIVLSSSMPNALKTLGPYEEADEDLIKILNYDFRINQKKLDLISRLFTGAIIYDKLALMSLTAETYSRHASLDIHVETGVDSVPSSKCLYKGLSCSIIASFDGKNMSKKLIIGSHTVNVLITSSTTITESRLQEVYVGPQVDINPNCFTVESTRIFFRSKEISVIKKAFDSESSSYTLPSSISNLRQLTSSFNHISTYAYLRATLVDFNDTRFMPVTIFTLCDTPDQDGYGSNHNSTAKIGSLLLQAIAINLSLKRNLSKENMSLFLTSYQFVPRNEDTESWKILDQAVTQMNALIEQNNDNPIEMTKFLMEVNLSKVASLVGNQLHKANKKVATNVKARLLELYA